MPSSNLRLEKIHTPEKSLYLKVHPPNWVTFHLSLYLVNCFMPAGHFSGDAIVVSIKRTGFHLSEDQISDWLLLFGTLESSLVFLPHPRKPGLKQDSLEVLMRLRKHILNTLPAYGRKLFVQYRGQPIQCSGCLEPGHIRKECKNPRSNWGSYVRSIFGTGKVPASYFGTWSSYFTVSSATPVATAEDESNESMDSIL